MYLCVYNLLIGLATLVMFVSAHWKIASEYHEKIGIPTAKRIKDAEENGLTYRIEKGSIAPEHAYPYLAGLLIDLLDSDVISFCGASLVTSNRLLTAAHCMAQAWQVTVILGSNRLFSGGTRIITNEVVTHPGWDPNVYLNDIAVIYLPTDVMFSDIIQPIDISTSFDSLEGQWATAAGFGITNYEKKTYPSVLNEIKLQVISLAECLSVYGPEYVHQSNLCTSGAGGVGTCSGDSGGPLVLFANGNPILIGISSYVSSCGCGIGLPSAFTRVSCFHDFIQQNLY